MNEQFHRDGVSVWGDSRRRYPLFECGEQFHWDGAVVWVSGATGAWGQEFCRQLLAKPISKLVAFARGEHRAAALAEALHDDRLRVHLGDIRDRHLLRTSLAEASVVIHLAALKRVDSAAFSPFEAASVNIDGTRAVIESVLALPLGTRPARCLYLSSDKACMPTTFYGATKYIAEQLWLGANVHSPRPHAPWFVAARSGNALGSTGSVLEIWRRQFDRGQPLTITDPGMTRFVMSLPSAVRQLLNWLGDVPGGSPAHPGELYIQDPVAVTVGDLAEAFAPGYPTQIIGSHGQGEKRDEMMSVNGPSSAELGRRLSVHELRIRLNTLGLLPPTPGAVDLAAHGFGFGAGPAKREEASHDPACLWAF